MTRWQTGRCTKTKALLIGEIAIVTPGLKWAIVPYLVAAALALISRNALIGIVAVALVLLVDAWTYYEVFFHPKGSTAALALLWMPIWNPVLVVPIGAFVGWIWSGMLPADQNAP